MIFDGVRLVGFTTVDLPMLGVSPTESFICKGIDNLGSVAFDVFMQPTTKMGSYYGGRRPQPLELLVKIGLNPNYGLAETPESLRTKIRGLLTGPSGYDEKILFKLMFEGGVIAQIPGVVKTVDPNVFDKDPSVGVTVACEGSYLQGAVESITGASGDVTVDNPGDAPAGFLLECDITGTPTEWSLYHDYTLDPTRFIKIDYAFADGDHVIIDTRYGSRKMTRVRSGGSLNLFSYLSDDSTWLMLHNGENTLTPSAETTDASVDLTYTPLYWGV